MNKLKCEHVLDARQFGTKECEIIFSRADKLKEAWKHNGKKNLNTRNGRLLLTLFFEPSTRTYISTNTAWQRLGGGFIGDQNAMNMSSYAKGESIEDSIRYFSNYEADLIAMRHPEEGSAMKAAAVSDVPIINCGDGPGQHPTQSLLDCYTVEKFKGKRFNGKREGLIKLYVGDLKYGRTVRSNVYLDAKLDPTTKFIFCAPDEFQIKQDILDYLDEVGSEYELTSELDKNLTRAHIVYITRLQEERLKTEGMTTADFDGIKARLDREVRPIYRIHEGNIHMVPPTSIIMHPGPIKSHNKDGTLLAYPEISDVKFKDPRVVMFIQGRHSIWLRGSLELILTEERDEFKVSFNTQAVMDKHYSHLEIH